MFEFLILAGCLTILQVVFQPHAWKLWVDAVNRPAGCHEYKVCYNTLDGSIGKPWNYRIFSAWMVWLGHKVIKNMFVLLVLIRFLQNFAILYLFKQYSDMYGHYHQFHVMALLVAMIIGYIGTDFRLNTHNETILLLLSFLFINTNMWLLVPLAAVAALNRETYGLFYIPAFLCWGFKDPILIAFCVFVGITIFLRVAIRTDKLTCPQHKPGLESVKTNLSNPASLLNVFAYFGLLRLPQIHLYDFNSSIISIGIINFICNLWYGNIRETALFINPYILLIPFL